MKDFLYRGLIRDLNIRFAYALTTEVANTAVTSHNCDPVAAHLLSRSLNAGVLCSPTLSENERATITWSYPGPIGKIQIDVGASADIRGMTRAKQLMDIVSSEADIYGDTGNVQMMKSNDFKVLSNGTCEAPMMDAISDLCYYFALSEQLETDMYISVGFNADPEKPVALCQGLLLQAMPDCDYEAMEKLRLTLHSDKIKNILNSLPENDSHIKIIEKLIEDIDSSPIYEIYPCHQPEFRCLCSREKTANVLTTLNKEDVADIVNQNENIVVSCQFCSTKYEFSPSDVKFITGY
jgi:molecular chaperone Hsp33